MNDKNGQFQKGQTKTGGRTKGSKNKATVKIKKRVQIFIDDNFEGMQEDMKTLTPSERIKVYLKLMEFVLPKQSTIDIEVSESKGIAPINWLNEPKEEAPKKAP